MKILIKLKTDILYFRLLNPIDKFNTYHIKFIPKITTSCYITNDIAILIISAAM